MNSLIARLACAFVIVIFIQFSVKAQDSLAAHKDTNKVVVIVAPGQQYKKPVRRRIAPSTAERSGTAYGDTTVSKPIRTTTTDYNTAPTTAEKTGYPAYMSPNYQKPQTRSKVGVGVNGLSTPVTNTPPVTTPPAASTTITTTKTSTSYTNGKKTVSTVKSDTVYIKKTDTVYVNKPENIKPRGMKMIFAEVGGPGLAISLNYDARFTAERGGLGFRIGAGYFSDSYGNTVFTVPMQVNYLLTKDENNFLELGAGTTFLNSTGNNKGRTFIFDKVTGFIGTATVGYRYQPVDHKLNFRIGFVPIFYDEGIILAGGVSIGYNF